MKRKLCSVLLALCMVLTLLPVSALAEERTPAEAEQVATQLPSAEDGVVTLESDTSISAAALQSAIANGLEINLNGKALTITSADTVSVPEGKTVKFYNGTILNSTFTRGDLAAFAAGKDATLIVDNVTMNTTGSAFFPAGNASAVTVTNSNITAGVYVIGTNASGNLSDNVRITLKDSTLTSTCYQNNDRDTCTVMINVPGTMNIDNCKIYGGRQVLFVRCGTATVNNSTITLSNAYNGAGTYDSKDWSSGNEVPMGAVVVGNRTNSTAYDTPATCTLNNTTVTGGRVYTYQKDEIAVKLNITGNSTINGAFVNGDGENGKATIVTESGTYSDLANAVAYAADGATIKLAGDVTVTKPIEVAKSMTLDLNGHVLTAATASNRSESNDVKNSAIWVTAEKVNLTIDGTTARSGMTMGDTHDTNWMTKVWGFVDLREGSAGSTVTVNGGSYTGSTCASDNYHYTALFTVGSESKLVLNNVIAETDERVVKASACGEVIVSGGTYNITGIDAFLGAAFETKTASFTNMKLTAKYGGCVQVGNNATFENCEIKVTDIRTGEGTHLNCAVAVQYGGTATVKSGIYTAPYAAYVYSSGGTINIENGTFTGVVRADATTDATATINIKNGSFNGEIQKGAGAGNETIAITGGTYTSDPSAYVASGAIARKDSDAQYTVVAKSNLTSGVYTSDPSSALAPGYVSYKNSDDTYTVYYPVPVTPGNTSSSTTKNPDGSTTTTTTDKTTGTVTETTKNPDGSTTTVETRKDGSVTETNKTAGGSVGTVKSDANGNSEISASISAADVNAAAKKNEPVAAPVSVAPAASSAAAPVIKLSVPASAGEVSVVIPVTNAQQGTVAIKVNPDGTEEIIKTSVVTKDGVVLGVKGSAQIKIVNNDKDFSDTVGHWAESDVDFVSARELFNGTAPQTFSPESATTRGMVVTVLARLAGESTDGGANWYDKGCAWAVTNGVSDGTDPNGTVTREQLAAMLYRYFGSPAVSGSLSFADASSVSEYAHDAMQWCVNNGIINGMDGLLNPQGQATRAQVSAMFARYIHLAATK